MNAVITKIWPNSIAEEVGLEPGDKILQINGIAVEDQIAFRFLQADESLEIEVLKSNGQTWIMDIQKEIDENLGIEFEEATFDGIKQCRNKCVFCFIDQLPANLRETLYVKDDDYRHSFLFGNYITLTNLLQKDFERIAELKLSPLYISIHTTNPELRKKLLNNKNADKVLEQLSYLVTHDISIHGQIVLVPGLNDGEELRNTIAYLATLAPNMLSLAVVPVGVTKLRKGLAPIKPFTKEQAAEVLDMIEDYQHKFLAQMGTRFVFAADEFYILAERNIPNEGYYEGFPQLENGVGIVRLFIEEFNELINCLPNKIESGRLKVILTSVSGYKVLESLVRQLLDKYSNLDIKLQAVVNDFFGSTVTVAGLLTGHDIIKSIKELNPAPKATVFIPDIMLNKDELFLDGLTINEVQQITGCYINAVTTSAKGLLEVMTGFTFEE